MWPIKEQTECTVHDSQNLFQRALSTNSPTTILSLMDLSEKKEKKTIETCRRDAQTWHYKGGWTLKSSQPRVGDSSQPTSLLILSTPSLTTINTTPEAFKDIIGVGLRPLLESRRITASHPPCFSQISKPHPNYQGPGPQYELSAPDPFPPHAVPHRHQRWTLSIS